MSNTKTFVNKALMSAVVIVTVFSMLGLGALVSPAGASAVSVDEIFTGDNARGNSPAVYYINADFKGVAYPNGLVFKQWTGKNAGAGDGVKRLDGNILDVISSAKNIVHPRPGYGIFTTPDRSGLFHMAPGQVAHQYADFDAIEGVWGMSVTDMIAKGWVYDYPSFFANQLDFASNKLDGSSIPAGMTVKVSETFYYVNADGMWYELDVDASDVFWPYASHNTVGADESDESLTLDDLDAPDQKGSSSDSSEDNTDGNDDPTSGNLTVSLSANTPASKTLSNSTAHNVMTTVRVKASNDDVVIRGLTVTVTGLITRTNIDAVSAWADGYLLGDPISSVSTDDTVVLGFDQPLTIEAGDHVDIDLAMSFGAAATSGVVGAQIAKASDIDTASSVSGSFPIGGDALFGLTDGSASLADVTLEMSSVGGLTTEPTSSTTGNLDVGDRQDIAKVKLTQSNGEAAIEAESFTFFFDGDIRDSDLGEFELRSHDNTVIATSEEMSDRYLHMRVVDGYTIPLSSNRTLTLSAKMVDGSGRFFRAQLQNNYDFVIRDLGTGFALLPSSDTASFALSASDGYFKMKSGSVSISKRSDSCSVSQSAGTSDIALATFDVRAIGEEFETRRVGLKIATSSVTAQALTGNVRLVVGGEVDSNCEVTGGKTVHTLSAGNSAFTLYNSASTQYTLSTRFTLPTDEALQVHVVGNIPSAATSASNYTVSIGNLYGKRLSTKDFLDNTPGSTANVDRNTVSVDVASLSAFKDTSYGNRTVPAGSTQTLGQWIFKAGDAEGICTNSVTLSFDGNNGGSFDAPTDLTAMQLYWGDEKFGGEIGTGATSSNTYNGSGFCLDRNETAVIRLKANVVSGTTGAVSTTLDTISSVGELTTNTVTNSTVVGQDITFGAANVVISAASDVSTISSIHQAGQTGVQVGKWKFDVANETITLNKIRFQLRDDSFVDDTGAGNFAGFKLYNANGTFIASGNYESGSGAGYVEFDGISYSLSANEITYLVLKADISGSGDLDSRSINMFVVRSDSSTDMEIFASTGGTLTTSQIDATSGDNTTNSRFATSTEYLYHDAAPSIAAVDFGGTINQSTQAQIFRFTVSNNGARELRLSTTTITVSASGLTGDTTATGTVSSWELWEVNGSGGLGTQLATTSTCVLSGGLNPAESCSSNTAAGASLNVTFGNENDVNSLLGDFTVGIGTSRTLALVADTNSIFNGKTQGSVTISGKLDGATGYSDADAAQESNWAGGTGGILAPDAPLLYFYTPVNGSETAANGASDSYDVIGRTLSLAL